MSPLGVLFAARIENPTGRRAGLEADTSWECRGLAWQSGPAGSSQDWWAALAIPSTAFAGSEGEAAKTAPLAGGGSAGRRSPGSPRSPRSPGGGRPPRRWRANFYRIERPRGSMPELSCWSPTLTDPPDFHRPDRFGVLELR